MINLGYWSPQAEVDRRHFLAARRAGGDRRLPKVRALGQLSRYLRDVGAMRPSEPRVVTAPERLIDDYCEWLVGERGLAPATVLRYEKLALYFLGERRTADDPLGTAGLTGADVS